MKRKYPIARYILTLIIFCALTPFRAHAESSVFGFIDRNIWTVPSTFSPGETVRIYTALINSTAQSGNGTVRFYIDDALVGTRPFTMRESDPVTFAWHDWTATEGTHAFSAEISGASLKDNPDSSGTTTIAKKSGIIMVKTSAAEATKNESGLPETSKNSNGTSSSEANSTSTKSVEYYTQKTGEAIDNAAESTREKLTTWRDSIDTKLNSAKKASSSANTSSSSVFSKTRNTNLSTDSNKNAFDSSDISASTLGTEKEISALSRFALSALRGVLTFFIGVSGSPIGIAAVILISFFIFSQIIQFIWRKATFRKN